MYVVRQSRVFWCTDVTQMCGAVSELKWTPDGTALALVWEKGGFSLWSVFGALLLHSMGMESGCVHVAACVCVST